MRREKGRAVRDKNPCSYNMTRQNVAWLKEMTQKMQRNSASNTLNLILCRVRFELDKDPTWLG